MREDLLIAAERNFMTRYPGGFENEGIFVKPTTTKNVIRVFELEDIQSKPRPSYTFYVKYKAYVLDMKSKVNPLLTQNNPAFTGFLMMATEGK